MEDIKKNNFYSYSYKFKQFALLPLRKDLREKKINYLKKIGFYKNVDIKSIITARLNANIIKNSFINTLQITFEVTEKCNLSCEYCAYGKFYKGKYDKRKNRNLNLKYALNLLDFLFNLWNTQYYNSFNRKIAIGFYGGEPLLNFPFIKQIVEYIEHNKKKLKNLSFKYTMTTNALLLKKHIQFLQKYNFSILISLDGNRSNNQYRKYSDNTEAFDDIIKNIDYVYNNYKNYFLTNVEFNSVLHNKNSVQDSFGYIYSRYNKIPRIAELNYSGINEDKIEEFKKIFKNKSESLSESEDCRFIKEKIFIEVPEIQSLTEFIHTYTHNVYKTYLEFFEGFESKKFIPTGTCIPFSRKIFLTVSGKLLPCETIQHKYTLGKVNNEGVHIDFAEIANKLNTYYDNLSYLCTKCYNFNKCKQCIFNLDLKEKKIKCNGFIPNRNIGITLKFYLKSLRKEPELYKKILNEVYYE